VTRADRIVIAVIAIAALAAWPLAAVAGPGEARVVTVSGPNGQTVSSLDVDQTLTIAGGRGEVVVRISDGYASVVSAECPDHTCMRTGRVSSPGAVIACVPNGVVVRIGGAGEDGLDARVR
jgi:hypothetical protein